MSGMRLDHLSYAAGPDGLAGTAQRIGGLLGKSFTDGGMHPRFGTRNMILPLADHTYLEVVEVLDHPASDKAPFGQAVRARSALGGGWLGWVVAVDDIETVERRLGRESAPGNRYLPDGTELTWKQIGVNGLISDPQLPFFIEWSIPRVPAPEHRRRQGDVSLACLEIAGDPQRVSEWLGETVEAPLEDVKVDWVAPHGTPGHPGGPVPDGQRPRPDLSDPRLPRGAIPSPNIWEHTATYEVENRAFDPDDLVFAAMARAYVVGRPHGPRPGLRHRLPPASLRGDRRLGDRRRAAPRPGRAGPAPYAIPRPRLRARRDRPGDPAARRVRRRRARALGLLLRPGLRARPARARARRTPRRHGLRDRQRRHAVDVRAVVPARVPEDRPRRRREVLGPARLDRDAGADALVVRHRGGPRGRGPHRVRPPTPPRRSWPSTGRRVAGPRSTTPSTSGPRY